MENDEIMKNINRVYIGLQHLNIQPTKNNTAIILDALQVLECLYKMMGQQSKEITASDNMIDPNAAIRGTVIPDEYDQNE